MNIIINAAEKERRVGERGGAKQNLSDVAFLYLFHTVEERRQVGLYFRCQSLIPPLPLSSLFSPLQITLADSK